MRMLLRLLPALLLALGTPAAVWATGGHTHHHHCGHPECDPDSVGSGLVTIEGPFGTYTAVKEYEVYSADNCGNPAPTPGSFTYVYKISNDPNSGVDLIGFRLQINGANTIVDAGFIDELGVEPTAVSVSGVEVYWDFTATHIMPGEMSEFLYIISPFQPGDTDVTINGDFGLDSGASCIGPTDLPEPAPCSAFFWQLRANGWHWIANKYFPGTQWDDVQARAVELSGGYFADETALTDALKKTHHMTSKERTERQLATLLLNVAAGELFPANTKCRLFLGSEVDLDGDDVPDGTVADQIAGLIADLESQDEDVHSGAFRRCLDHNLGRTVRRAVRFH